MNKNHVLYRIKVVVANVFIFILSFTCVFPVVWIFYSSLKTNTELFANLLSLPSRLNFQNYIDVFSEFKIMHYLKNTFIHSVSAVVFILLLGFIAGYFLSRYTFKGRNLIYGMFMSGILIPIHALLVPVYMEFRMFNIVNTRFALIIPYIAFNLPLAVFLVEAYIKSIPIEMEEAAVIEGATITQTLARIILPMSKPVMATILVLSFNSTWNEFAFGLTLVSGDRFKNISVALRSFASEWTVDYVRQMAASVLATIPVLLVYTFFCKRIIQGMVAGAVKG